MGYRSLQDCVADLERTGQLVRINVEIDPHLEAAEIQRRAYQAGGPAILFNRVKGCRFRMVSNLFGTLDRTRFLFRDALEAVRHLVELKIDPIAFARNPWRYRDVPRSLWTMWVRRCRTGPVMDCEAALDQLPRLQSWPNDGGPFVTLPQVYTEHPDRHGFAKSNLGMYRVQLAGNEYVPNREAGLHYQIHRSIGVHHAAAIRRGERLPVNVFVGGPPAMTLAAVMPLPEGLSELLFAAALGRRPIRMVTRPNGLPIWADADFCLSGSIDPSATKPEGPFGDHLGYYSLQHEFPAMQVDQVYHRKDAIWPFTVVGRPPQEDTSFGQIIHELTGPIIPTVIPGVKEIHAVDAAGVHPLLLAIGSERYVPYATERRPQELLTIANAILGQGQLSLAKYLIIAAQEDSPDLDLHDIGRFFQHVLERVDWRTDLHFQTQTTIDTLDYSGHGFNAGSKVVIAAAGPKRRALPTVLPAEFSLPVGLHSPCVCAPGILAVSIAAGQQPTGCDPWASVSLDHSLNQFPLILLVDDAEFAARTLNNWLWVTFTRSNPAADIHGIGAFTHDKHWGCRGSLVINARIKPHHAPPLIEDPAVTRRVDALAAPGGPLHGVL
ncbi:MAG TPA: UbiD family decarboxylase [Planctomycetaceae bacterium]|nr:UbiD family decarboxylase [Planctomycetaceae bacterium]